VDAFVTLQLNRREFFGVTLLGLARKSGREIGGVFVHESHAIGHRLRDGARFPVPQRTRKIPIVIVGGGIAGLSAAWRLQKRGADFVVLEMEETAGGNARSGHNETTRFPWAAHYLPVPGPRATLVRELLEELGVYEQGAWNERFLCQAPQERLFLHGRWQEGLEPQTGPTPRDRDQLARFEAHVETARASGHFTIPMALGARPSPLDGRSMADWLREQGLDSPWLLWTIDYACRDDYGARADATSAWAGLHYFASREPAEIGPLTWPEGNGWITNRLLERLGPSVRTGQIVYRIVRSGRQWSVMTPDTAWVADAVIFAAPSFLASRIIEHGPAAPDFEYSPWLTANVWLDRWPAERGLPPAWDNVIFDSPSLGYVVATHQSLRTFIPRTVWTYYWALDRGAPRANRAWLLAQDWRTLRDRVLNDLSRAHPDIRDCATRVDICRMGHAMIRPTPGFLTSATRRQLATARGRLFYAHSDLSGVSIFEEAQYRGVTAADEALRVISG
jgi:glycine/D-amino acid oxidase-like deaminating enzyme